MLGDRAYFTPDQLQSLADAVRDAAGSADPHQAGLAVLTRFLSEHFPALCETIAEVVRNSDHHRFHYWCDVAEMSAYANYHFTLDRKLPFEQAAQSTSNAAVGSENIH